MEEVLSEWILLTKAKQCQRPQHLSSTVVAEPYTQVRFRRNTNPYSWIRLQEIDQCVQKDSNGSFFLPGIYSPRLIPYRDSLQRPALVLYWGCYSIWCFHPSEHIPANSSYKCLYICLSCIHSLVIPSQGSATKLCGRRQLRVILRRTTMISKFCSKHK